MGAIYTEVMRAWSLRLSTIRNVIICKTMMDDGDWCLCILCGVCWSGWPVVVFPATLRPLLLAPFYSGSCRPPSIESLPSPARLYYAYKWYQRADWLAFNGLARFIWAFLLIIIPFLSRIICINRFWYSSFSSSSLSLFFCVFFPLFLPIFTRLPTGRVQLWWPLSSLFRFLRRSGRLFRWRRRK